VNAKKGARLVSLNAGKPGPLPYRGRTVQSGIVKTPVEGPLRLDHAGLEGDAQADLAGHGGPDRRACVYPVEHRPYWAARIGHPLGHGAFGENFSTEGLLESEVVVGDVYRVGAPGRGTVVQVSQPRTPCYKLAARHGVKELAAWFAEAGITGFYLRLVEPGEVRPGDALALLDRPAHGVTVLEANRVMYRDRHDEAGLERVLAVPELSGSWLETFGDRLAEVARRPIEKR
jgi:MOSC domain-containing protein YiiM